MKGSRIIPHDCIKGCNILPSTRTLIFALLILTGFSTEIQAQTSQPNVLILLADDLGYGDLSCYGSQSIHTPHLDQLALEGKTYTQFYTGSAVCSPSRVSLLTGKYPLRYDVRKHFSDKEEHLPTSAQTLAELLGENGYMTAHIGKWHLGGLRPQDYEARAKGELANPGPLEHGFDHYLSNIEGAPIRPQLIKDRKLYREGGQYLIENDRRIDPDSAHWTEIKVREAIRFIAKSQQQEKPFFMNLWFDVPHTPYEPAPEPHLSKYRKRGIEGDQLLFRSMVSHLDAQIGKLIEYLKKEDLFDQTIIVFASDNGPAFQGNPGPFKGGKTDLHEGGIRVPLLTVWPGHIPANSRSFQLTHMADLLPTIASAAGIETEHLTLDGENLIQNWTENKLLKRGPIFWQMDLYRHFQNQGPKPTPYATAVVQEDGWKLLYHEGKAVALYNLNDDFREIYNVLDEHPDISEKLLTKLSAFLFAPRDKSGFP